MSSARSNFLRCLGGLLALTLATWVIEAVAISAAFHHRLLAPYAYFANQTFDFLCKLRFAAGFLPSWVPGLPDGFAGLTVGDKLLYALALLAPSLCVALGIGAIGAAAAAATQRRVRSVRQYVMAWAVFGLIVHVAVAVPTLGLQDGLRLGKTLYRLRGLVVDGAVLAMAVWALGTLSALRLAPMLEISRSARTITAGLLLGLTAVGWWQQPAIVAVAAAPSPASAAGGDGAAAYNVVLISLDSLRADHLRTYGYQRDTAPAIDRMAREGVVFDNAIATSSWTLPTHVTMFTGRYQLSHGVIDETSVLPSSIPTLGQIFKAAGFSSAGFASGPYLAGHYGYERGMDTYRDLSARFSDPREARSAILSPEINADALGWLDAHATERFFLFLHYFDIHYDYVPPAPYDTMFDPDYTGTMDGRNFIERSDVNARMNGRDLDHVRALYDGEIRFTDEHVGRVLDKLEALGVLEKTVVLLVADHGDEFFEHGNKGHHRTVYDEVIRVPFVLRLPGKTHAGVRIQDQVSLVDVLPTLLESAAVATPPETEGVSVRHFLEGSPPQRDAVYSDFYDKQGFNLQVARRTPADKTIHHFNRITHPTRGAIEYYDLAADPRERNDVSSTRRDAVTSSLTNMGDWLGQQWRAQRSAEAASGGHSSIKIDEDTMERLKSLGYVGE
ncbi:MAG: sulfatase [Deltaproteobacteria bacterium]|nr:sulfatase [Deltaproteobacteria bacterium]